MTAAILVAASLGLAMVGPLAQIQAKAPAASAALLRQLGQLERDLGQLDRALGEIPNSKETSLASLADAPSGSLLAPANSAIPNQADALTIRQELHLTLAQAQELALIND